MIGHEHRPAEPVVDDLANARFVVEFEYYWERLSAGMELLVTPEELDALKMRAISKEFEFYQKVEQGVKAVAGTHNGPVICLFDVDGTIGEVKDDMSADLHTLLRPAVTPLIADLAVSYPEQLRFGILSLRPQQSLDEEMENPTFLSPIRPFLDSELVKSSEEETRNDPFINGTYDDECKAALLNRLSGLMDQAVLDATLRGEVDLFEWYDPKLVMLARILERNADTAIVLVDDLPGTEFFNTNNTRMKGICVKDQQQILIPAF